MFQVMQLSICPPPVFWQISKYIGLTVDFDAEKNQEACRSPGTHHSRDKDVHMLTKWPNAYLSYLDFVAVRRWRFVLQKNCSCFLLFWLWLNGQAKSWLHTSRAPCHMFQNGMVCDVWNWFQVLLLGTNVDETIHPTLFGLSFLRWSTCHHLNWAVICHNSEMMQNHVVFLYIDT